MKEFATENELLDINRVEASTARQYDEWDDPALAVVLYCPGRDVEPLGYLFSSKKRRDHSSPKTKRIFSLVSRRADLIFPVLTRLAQPRAWPIRRDN